MTIPATTDTTHGLDTQYSAAHRLAGEFVTISLPLIAELDGNVPAALLVAWIEFKTTNGFEYAPTRDELATALGQTPRKIDTAITLLRDRGILRTERVDKWSPTLTYSIVWDAPEASPKREPVIPEHGARDPESGISSLQEHQEEQEPGLFRELSLSLVADSESAAKVDPLAAEFAGFWNDYPRKVERKAAERAYRKARKSADLNTIQRGLAAARVTWVGTDPKYIPHPASWLNGERWADEVDPVKVEPPEENEWMRRRPAGYQG